MKLYRSLKEVNITTESVVTIGVFDGLHKGHIRMIKMLHKRAKDSQRRSLVLTFYPHPLSVLYPDRKISLLLSLEHRLKLLGDMGVDIVVLTKFTKKFSMIRPEVFIRDILIKKLNMREILFGENFCFGWKRSGDIELLASLSKKYGFKLTKIPLLKTTTRKGKISISSTYIRSLVLKGRLNEARRLLGRPVTILGTVKRGTKRGRLLGYPTANIDPHHEAIPPSGVYAVYVKIDKRGYEGLLNIGIRPTFYSERYLRDPVIEVHIFNFKKDIYGKTLEIAFVKKLRPEKRFKDKENLIRRIRLDEKEAMKIFRSKKEFKEYRI